MTQEGVEGLKTAADVGAGATVLGTFLGYLPEAAGALTILWYLIRLYEWAEKRFGFGRGADGPTTKE